MLMMSISEFPKSVNSPHLQNSTTVQHWWNQLLSQL